MTEQTTNTHGFDRTRQPQTAEPRAAAAGLLDATPVSPSMSGLAAGSPAQEIRGPQNWYGADMKSRTREWSHTWTPEEIAEIEAAATPIARAGRDLVTVAKNDFPLPSVAHRIAAVGRYVLDGQGFYLLRGLPVHRWDPRLAATIFWGLGMHLGAPCSQNGKGHVLGHVTNLGVDYADPEARGYQTNARLAYHTDSCDIVGLLCLRTAKSGGLSSVVSSTTLYNEMLRRRPDLLGLLMQPFHRTRWAEIPAGKMPWAEVPVFMPHGGRVIAHYVRSAIRKGQLLDGVPKLSREREEALDFLDSLAQDPEIHLDMTFEPGDLQLVCNHSMFHSRTAYEDFPEPERRRHLLRLWLACDEGPELPGWLTKVYAGETSNGRPNGIVVPGVPFKASLIAE